MLDAPVDRRCVRRGDVVTRGRGRSRVLRRARGDRGAAPAVARACASIRRCPPAIAAAIAGLDLGARHQGREPVRLRVLARRRRVGLQPDRSHVPRVVGRGRLLRRAGRSAHDVHDGRQRSRARGDARRRRASTACATSWRSCIPRAARSSSGPAITVAWTEEPFTRRRLRRVPAEPGRRVLGAAARGYRSDPLRGRAPRGAGRATWRARCAAACASRPAGHHRNESRDSSGTGSAVRSRRTSLIAEIRRSDGDTNDRARLGGRCPRPRRWRSALAAAPAVACGGLVGENGTIKLTRTTTLAAYHDGVERYVTSFEFSGQGRVGRLDRAAPRRAVEGRARRRLDVATPRARSRAAAAGALRAAGRGREVPTAREVILSTKIDALDITVLQGGGARGRQVGDRARLPALARRARDARLLRAPQPDLHGRAIRRVAREPARPERG